MSSLKKMFARYLNAVSKSLPVAEYTWQAQAAGQGGQGEPKWDDGIWRAEGTGRAARAVWMRPGAFRAPQVRAREEQRDGTAVTSHLGLLCRPRSHQVLGMFPASPWSVAWHPSSWARHETLWGIGFRWSTAAFLSPNEAWDCGKSRRVMQVYH